MAKIRCFNYDKQKYACLNRAIAFYVTG